MSDQIISRVIRRIKSGQLLPSISRRLHLLTMIPSQLRLARNKREQITTFNALRYEFTEIYDKLQRCDIPLQFVEPCWQEFNAKLEEIFFPNPPSSFLRDRLFGFILSFARGGRALKEELRFLESKVPKDKLCLILQEDYIGKPILFSSKYLTSHNSIHHLYHLVRFSHARKCDLQQINTVVEWGGGYGNMAKIFQRLKSAPLTYIIIDTPMVSCIQWLYLATTLGKESVNILQSSDDTIQTGKINLVPLCFVNENDKGGPFCNKSQNGNPISVDLFLSTWALSESSKYAQDYVASRDWFGSKHILLAYVGRSDSFCDSGRVGEIAASGGATIEEITFLPGRYYAFR